jgi:CelD/BcsL family acetyltransferase involved in cellulose biosynthesis
MTQVVEINDPAELAGYRLLWNALLPRSPAASFFQTLDWLEVYWRHSGQQQRLRVLIAYSAGQPLGILPLVVRNEPTRIGSIRVLGYPLDSWGTVYGPIGPSPTATLLAGLGHIARSPRDWDLIDLRWVGSTGGEVARTAEALAIKGFSAHPTLLATSSQIDTRGSWGDYWAGRTSRWRNNVRRSEKKLAERGEVVYLRYRPRGAACDDGDPRWDLYDTCEQLARASWQGSSDTGNTLTHATVQPLLRDMHEAAARSGGADVNLLYVGGQPAAFNYAYHYRGNVFGLRTGFDPAFGEGAGSVLQRRMIEDCFARGDRTYDLGADYPHCKRYWLTHTSASYRLTHYPLSSPRAQALRLSRWLGQHLVIRSAAVGA